MENLLDNIDPFEVLGLDYKFEIPNLYLIYYEKYRYSSDKSLINLAYEILKDPVKKMLCLCKKNKARQVEKDVLAEVFHLLNETKDLNLLLKEFFNQATQLAIDESWGKCWTILQKYLFLLKHTKI